MDVRIRWPKLEKSIGFLQNVTPPPKKKRTYTRKIDGCKMFFFEKNGRLFGGHSLIFGGATNHFEVILGEMNSLGPRESEWDMSDQGHHA